MDVLREEKEDVDLEEAMVRIVDMELCCCFSLDDDVDNVLLRVVAVGGGGGGSLLAVGVVGAVGVVDDGVVLVDVDALVAINDDDEIDEIFSLE